LELRDKIGLMDIDLGRLYIIATPIGNLKDITYRAVETMKMVDLVVSEDTRETSKLFSVYEISKPQLIYTDQKHNEVIHRILQELSSGKNIALVSDSGTPLISDPGFKLVNEVRSSGYEVEIIPGPNAAIAALA